MGMRIEVDRAALVGALGKVQGVTGSKSTLLVLNNVLLEAKAGAGGLGGVLEVHGTDLDVSIQAACPCEVLEEGAVTLPSKRLFELVKSLREDRLTLAVDEKEHAVLKAGKVSSRLPGVAASEFPDVKTYGEAARYPVGVVDVLRMIEKTLFSVSTDEGRPNLNGALLRVVGDGFGPVGVGEAGRLSMVSTDGHRLSRLVLEAVEGASWPDALRAGVIVPRKGLAEVRRVLDVAGEALTFGVYENTVAFKQGSTVVAVRLIDGRFPDVSQVLPLRGDRCLLARRSDLLHALRFVSIVAPSKTGGIKVTVEGGECEISTMDADQGEAREAVPVEWDGGALVAGYNYRYLQEALAALEGDEVEVEIIDTLSPTMLREVGSEDLLYVVMPMRV